MAISDIRTLIVARFAVKPGLALTWTMTPVSLPILQKNGIPFDAKGEFVPPDEWRAARNLNSPDHVKLIQDNSSSFREYLTEMIHSYPDTLDRCTVHVSQMEFSLLLSYGGQEVYDFFVFDHRFGAPPRGRMYRSNLRGKWVEKVGDRKISRPDMAIVALERKIRHAKSISSSVDVSDLESELCRRQDMIKKGLDPLDGKRIFDKRDTPCPVCNRLMTTSGLARHISAAHGEAAAMDYINRRDGETDGHRAR